jgi:ATP-dependent DNA ligase
MLSRLRALPGGLIAPCLPINAPQPPSGEQWLHEIKHDGFRIIARKNGKRVKLYSRPGNDLTYRFPLIVEAIAKLRSRSCIIDGEAVACGEDGIASFDRIRYRHNDDGVFLYAFDLIELDGDDLRRNPLIVRKTTLGSLLSRAALGLRLNEHLEADGPDVFHHACKLGLETMSSEPVAVEFLRNPITGMAGCCARTVSGHAAAPPRSVMNSRRFITRLPRRRARSAWARR